MTEQQHPITPPPELVEQWCHKWTAGRFDLYLATQAAHWAADQELEACVEWLVAHRWFGSSNSGALRGLRAARRPKPPSLKEQALDALEMEDDSMPLRSIARGERFALIRRALEQLNE